MFDAVQGFQTSNIKHQTSLSCICICTLLTVGTPKLGVPAFLIQSSYGQTITLRDSSTNMPVVNLEEFVISASKFEEKKSDIPFRIETISHKQIEMLNPQTSADVLQMSGNIMVQKSQMGGGSPVIRGFEANKILLVVDGVRMNNAIYRSGHLQNVITIDNAILERTEIVFGPASVIYGSDALGGVMHFYTKNPILAGNDTSVYGERSRTVNSNLNAYVRYSSANSERTNHFDFQFGFNKIGFLTSITHSNFGDLRMGSSRKPEYPGSGKVLSYAGRIDGKDTMLINDNPNIHKPTGYSQDNFVQKILYRPDANLTLALNIQYSTSTNIPRFDMLNDTLQGGGLKYAEWNYGPQKRLLTSIRADLITKSKLFDKSNLVLAYQKIDEDRITRKFGDDYSINREEDVKVYSLNIDFIKKINVFHNLQYGLEAAHNDVISTAFSENIVDNTIGLATTRYPDGGSAMQVYAGYLNYRWHVSKKSIVNTGVRYSRALLHSDFRDTTFYKLPYNEIDINTGSLTGSVSFVYHPADKWQVGLLASTGFRSPNVDDYGKMFAKNDFVTIPNANLKPEYIYNGEMNISKVFSERIKVNASVFYTRLTDAIVMKAVDVNENDSLEYEGEILKIQANTNAEEAFIYGAYAGITADINKNLLFESTLNYTFGRNITDNTPLSHIPPVFGRSGITYNYKKINTSIYAHYNGWKHKKDYGSSTEDNLSEATADGTPSWYTLNFTSSYKLQLSTENLLYLQFAIENILDRHYKPFASGISAPGRNFILALRVNI